MIFEETYIRNLLKCSQCCEKFDDYEQPKSLPCGKIICSVCMVKIEKEAIDNKFKCICLKIHQIPEDGFGINELANQLIKAKAKEIWRGEQYEQLKINLKKLKSIKIDLSFDLCTGSDKIKEHCNEQRRLVQLAYENKIQELNTIIEKLMAEIDKFEMECKQSYSNLDDSFKDKVNRLINEAKSFLDEKQEYLKQMQLDEDEIIRINKISEDFQIELQKELTNLKKKIFGKKLIIFNSNLCKISPKTLGQMDYEIIITV